MKYQIKPNLVYVLPYKLNSQNQLYNIVKEVDRRIENSISGIEKNINKILGCYK